MKNNNIFGLLEFNNEIEFNDFKKKLTEWIKNNYTFDNENFTFTNNFCICKLNKNNTPKWTKKCIVENDIIEKETKNNRLLLYKYKNCKYYIEKNGSIKLEAFLENYNYEKYNLQEWKKINNTKPIKRIELSNCIDKYYLNKPQELINQLKKNDIFKKHNIIDIDNFSLNIILDFFVDFEENKQLDNKFKLIPYNKNNCTINNKSSETKYNTLVCENNQYINLDCEIKLTKNCEIADIYDLSNNLLFHNKKISDLRVLSCQVFIGALILKDKKESEEFIKKYGILNDFSYIFGIIKNKKNNKITSFKDKLSIGLCCYVLHKLEIKYFIHYIDYIEN